MIYIINPNKIKLTAAKLIKEDNEAFEKESINTIPRIKFLDKFIELEQLIRKIAKEKNVNFINNRGQEKLDSLNSLIYGLFRQLLINEKQYHDLKNINRFRNLVVHGEINSIEPKIIEQIQSIINHLETKIFVNDNNI
ncbi:MAG: hypothetical protein HC905_05900 [Bacteroidales bacterium]|nr:hypothetical protein [Bacteroidales bacterium]